MARPTGVVDFTPDPELYPFESRWFDSTVGPVHYIDEGDGPVVLLLHGNPNWSFIYRKIITALGSDVRCIAPDYPGFGLSPHPDGYGYTPEEQSKVVSEFIEHLDLRNIVIVGADWGGPIGMEVASRAPERVKALVMANTWFWPAEQRMMKIFPRVMGSWPIQALIRRRNFFVTTLMKRDLQVTLSAREFAHYTDVLPTPASRKGTAVFPTRIRKSRQWLVELEKRVAETLRGKPAALLFGKKDPALGSDFTVARWRQEFPDAGVVEVAAAGHYFQEDEPEACVTAIRQMLAMPTTS